MKIALSAVLIVLFCGSHSTFAQAQVRTASLVVHIEGKRKTPSINSADVIVFDNDQKLDASTVKIEPAFGTDGVFAILVDASGSNQDKVAFTKRSLMDIFEAASSSGLSKAMLFTFAETLEGGKGWVSKAEVQQGISTFQPKRGAPSPLYGAIVEVAKSLGTATTDARRLMFVVTDGDDTSAGVTSQDAVDACLKYSVTIVPIGLLSNGKEKIGKANLLALAKGTGGSAVILESPANVNALVTSILKSEYIVTFVPANNSGLHRVKMEMSDAPNGLSLQAPAAYYAR